MEVSYYPGCSLHGMASEYDASLKAVCRALGVELKELDDWSCCGSSSAHTVSDGLAAGLAGRNLDLLGKDDTTLLVPCSSCFQRLRHAQLERGAAARPVEIFHVNEFFDRPEVLRGLRAKVKRPLTGLKGVAYYGCLSQRPPKVTGARAAENPVSMDRLLETLGMEVVPWSYKTDCCGGGMAVTRPDIVKKLSGDLFAAAQDAGAECIVTDCPMCQSNLDTREGEIEAEKGVQFGLPVLYVTELMALALGEGGGWWRKHFVDPRPLLRGKGLVDG